MWLSWNFQSFPWFPVFRAILGNRAGPVSFIYFWLNYCDKNHIERIPVAVKNIDHLFRMASEMIEADSLHLFLLSDGTRIDDNEYLESLENVTELIVCTEKQIQKLLIYFELKRYLNLKKISHPLNIDHFLWYQNKFDVHQSGYKRYKFSLVQSVFNSLYIWVWTSKRSSKRVRSR